MNYLLDTNIVSESSKRKPNAQVIAWLDQLGAANMYIASVSLGEIARGIALLELTQRKTELELWYNDMRQSTQTQIVSADAEIFECWAQQHAKLSKQGKTPSLLDTLIAATTIVKDFTLVTRNVKDFQMFSIKLENPFD